MSLCKGVTAFWMNIGLVVCSQSGGFTLTISSAYGLPVFFDIFT